MKQIKKAVLSTFVCDTYSLGSHWVYDEKELSNLPIDFEMLNAPQSMWHKGKEKGDFTHYGDQNLFLLEYIDKNRDFDTIAYYNSWKEHMLYYEGYVDASTRESLKKRGASSQDLSICGRISPLLLCSDTREIFLKNVSDFVSLTHNSELALNASAFFAELLWHSQENSDTYSLIKGLKTKYKMLSNWIDEAIEKKDSDSFNVIRDFGPACGIEGGFAGVIYLLLQDKDFKTIMIENAKAGGDSSARGMVVAMILGISTDTELPHNWLDEMKQYNNIEKILKGF